MNFFQILGSVLIIIGTIISLFGNYQQSRKDDKFQNNVSNYVSDQINTNIPIIKAIRIKDSHNFNLSKVILKNIGKTTATNVRLIFDPDSSPSSFSTNLITQIREITPGKEVEVNLNLFSGISLLEKLPNSDQDFKNKLLKDLHDFKNGSKVFIPKFHVEYFCDNKVVKSEQYFLIVEFRKGITAFDKSLID